MSQGEPLEPIAAAGARYAFRKRGSLWEIIFGGGRAFYLEDTLGARYLHYLLLHPNESIRALDLEAEAQPEKAEARSAVSIQPRSDGRALRQYRQALDELRRELAGAHAAGGVGEQERLAEQVEALEAALAGGTAGTDAGERARNNVRRAVRVIVARLQRGRPEERAFAQHLRDHLDTGYECLYSQEQGRVWE